MSTSNEMQFEPSDALEIVTLQDGETLQDEPIPDEGPAKVQMTQEEYSQLLAGKDSSQAITKGLESLAQRLGPQGQPAPAAVDDWNPTQIEEDFFKPGKGVEAIQKVASRMIGQQTSQMAVAFQQQEKKILRVDPETAELFKKYEGEIEARVQGLPPEYRFQPSIYGQVYRAILQEKQPEIIQMRADSMIQTRVDAAVKAALEAAGVQVGEPKAAQKGVYSEGSPGGKPPVKKTRLVITSADKQDMLESLMDPTDVDQVQSYLRDKARRGGK